MTQDELTEMIDLYVSDELPDALKGFVEARIALSPGTAHDAATLRAAMILLRASTEERPDAWFTERLLDTLLREQSVEPRSLISR